MLLAAIPILCFKFFYLYIKNVKIKNKLLGAIFIKPQKVNCKMMDPIHKLSLYT